MAHKKRTGSISHSLQKSLQKDSSDDASMNAKNLILTSGGTWAFRMVVPMDVRATLPRNNPAEIGSSNIYVGLGSDKQVAVLEALSLNAEWKKNIVNERRRLLGMERVKMRTCAQISSFPQYRNLSEITREEVENFILGYFIEKEKRDEEWRNRVVIMSTEEKREVMENIADDLSHWSRKGDYPEDPRFWDLEPFLKDRGVLMDNSEDEDLKSYTALLIRAELEHLHRKVEVLDGSHEWPRDTFFPLRGNAKASYVVTRGSPGKKKHTIGDLCNAFLERKRQEQKAPRTMKNVESAIEIMKEFFGERTFLKDITSADGEEYVRFLMKIPKSARKRYPGKTLRAAAEKESKSRHPLLLARNTLEKNFVWSRLCFQEAVSILHLEYDLQNPLRNEYKRLFPQQGEERTNPVFTMAQLQEIFSSEQYRMAHRSQKGRGKFWIPLLCLFQGFRLDEATLLTVGNLVENEGIKCLRITTLASDGKTVIKRIKRKSSKRDIPLHPEIIKLGFLEFVEEVRKSKESPDAQLFPEYPFNLSAEGSIGDKAGDWFRIHVRDVLFGRMAEGGERAPAIHSLRHVWRTALRRARIDTFEVEKLGGWSSSNKSQEANYGEVIWTHLQEAINKVTYPGVDLSHFYPVSDMDSRQRRRRRVWNE